MIDVKNRELRCASATVGLVLLSGVVSAPAVANSWACASDTYKDAQATGVDSAPYRITVGSGGSLYVLRNQHFTPADWQAGDELKICIDLTYPAKFKAYDVTNVRLDKRILTSDIGDDSTAGSKPSSSEQGGQ